MSIGMYQASVPVFIRTLTSVSAVLDKAEAHALQNKIEPAALLTARLFPNMYTLARQVQEVTKHAVWGCSLLSGGDNPHTPNVESTFAELKQRLARTVEFVGTFKPEQINGSEERRIAIKFPTRTLEMIGQPYLFEFCLPNLFFHAATAYDILRHNGVELVKRDYLGPA